VRSKNRGVYYKIMKNNLKYPVKMEAISKKDIFLLKNN
jgi:hypothetical protein